MSQSAVVSPECSLCPQSAVHFPWLQFMFLKYSLYSQSTVYVPRVQFMSQSAVYVSRVQYISPQNSICSHSLCFHSTVYVRSVIVHFTWLQIMSLECSLWLQSTVYIPTEQYMFPQFMFPAYNLCPKSTVNVPWLQFMSQSAVVSPECSLCPQSAVHFPWLQFMSLEYSIYSHRTVYVATEQFMFPQSILCLHSPVYVHTE